IRRTPAAQEAIGEIFANLPRGAASSEDPLSVLKAAIADLKALHRDVETGATIITDYLRMVTERVTNEIPLGATCAQSLMQECEQAFESTPPQTVASVAPVASDDEKAPITEPLLVVDDDESVRRTLTDLLDRRGFKNIVVAASLSEALTAAKK